MNNSLQKGLSLYRDNQQEKILLTFCKKSIPKVQKMAEQCK